MMGGFEGFGGGMGFGGFGMILFWGLVIAGVVVLARWVGGFGASVTSRGGERTPLEILRERYAKGEIDQREFEQKRRDLGVG
ncbi:MAG TPA: SHOCT domain-containing protein [Burkholderiales bacterium]|nr:SHOCT domain-containing protein [Burkholderiales bacterium]